MKVSFKGNVNLRGRVNVKRRVGSRSNGSTPSLQTIRRAVRLEMNRGLHQLQRNLQGLRQGVRRDLRRELYSPRFSNMIRNAVTDPNGFRDIANQYLNQNVIVTTTAGPVAGTLIRVGTNFLVVQETASSILIIPFSGAASIRPQ